MPANNKKAIFYPHQEGKVSPFYDNAYEVLKAGLDAKYGIDAPTMTALATHKDNIPQLIDKAHAAKQRSQETSIVKNHELFNSKKDIMRVFSVIVNAPNFDEADAEKLGIRVSSTPTDYSAVQPKVLNITVLPDKVILEWLKGTLDGVFIEGSFDKVNWEKLDKDNRSPFEDVRKNQKANLPELRYYRLRYFKNDEAVGLYSDIITVNCDIE